MTSIIPGSSTSNRVFQGQRKDFIVMRKDTFEYTGTYSYVHTDGTTVQYDFTDCVGMMHIKKKKTDTTALKSVGITFDEYEYTLTIEADEMDLDAGKYFYDLQIYDADSKMVTKLYGSFIVLQDITDFEGVIEKEYWVIFESLVENEVQPSHKIIVSVSNTILNEIQPIAKVNYTAMLDSVITTVYSVEKALSVMFNSAISVIRGINQTYSTIFSNSISNTTYSNAYIDTQMFRSSVTVQQLGIIAE